MPGMHCDGCGRYLLYMQERVEVRIEGRHLSASVVLEKTPAPERPAAVGRYHRDCYEEARQLDPRLPATASSG